MKVSEKYKKASTTGNNASQQLIFIFDEIMKLLYSAQTALEQKNYEVKFKTLSRIIEVFYMLKSGIDPETDNQSTKIMNNFYGATIVHLEKMQLHAEKPEELVIIISAVSDVRDALYDTMKRINQAEESQQEELQAPF